MKLRKKILLIICAIFLTIPTVVNADIVCSDYKAEGCPSRICAVKNGECIENFIGNDFCTEENVINAFRVLGYFLYAAKILVPLIIIGIGTFDFVKIVMSQDPTKLSKGAKSLGIRVAIGLCIFFLPAIVELLLDATEVNYKDSNFHYKACATCLLAPANCEKGAPVKYYNPYDIFVPASSNILHEQAKNKYGTRYINTCGVYTNNEILCKKAGCEYDYETRACVVPEGGIKKTTVETTTTTTTKFVDTEVENRHIEPCKNFDKNIAMCNSNGCEYRYDIGFCIVKKEQEPTPTTTKFVDEIENRHIEPCSLYESKTSCENDNMCEFYESPNRRWCIVKKEFLN